MIKQIKGLSVIGVQQIDRIVEVVEETLKGNSVRLFGKKKKDSRKYGGASLNLPKVRRNPLIEIIAINTGYHIHSQKLIGKYFFIKDNISAIYYITKSCLNECTYCKTKHARGELGSYYPDEIIERIRQSFEGKCILVFKKFSTNVLASSHLNIAYFILHLNIEYIDEEISKNTNFKSTAPIFLRIFYKIKLFSYKFWKNHMNIYFFS